MLILHNGPPNKVTIKRFHYNMQKKYFEIKRNDVRVCIVCKQNASNKYFLLFGYFNSNQTNPLANGKLFKSG